MGFSAQSLRAQAPRAEGTKPKDTECRSHFPLATLSLEDAAT